MNAPRRYTPLYEGMVVRWANLAAVQRYLSRLTSTSGPFRLVEIGVGSGVTANELVSDLIDRGVPYQYYGIDALVDEESKCMKMHHPNMQLITGDSCEVSHRVSPGIHFLFIDGDHGYEAVKKDILLYAPKVVENGIIAMHDIAYTGVGIVMMEMIQGGDFELMLASHEPISYPDLTPGIGVLRKVTK